MDRKETVKYFYAYVISEFIMKGTHKGEWLGMKLTGKKRTFIGVDIDKVIGGKIVEHGGAVNTFETLFQEGFIRPKDSTNVAEACPMHLDGYCPGCGGG